MCIQTLEFAIGTTLYIDEFVISHKYNTRKCIEIKTYPL